MIDMGSPPSPWRATWLLVVLGALAIASAPKAQSGSTAQAKPSAQSGPDWAAVRQRAVAMAQEIDAAERRLKGAVTADAMTALLRSERFSIEQLALSAVDARKDPAVLAAVIRHLFTRTEGIVVFSKSTGDATYYRLLRFDELTGDLEYRAGNTAPKVGRLKGADVEMPDVRIPSYGLCKGQLQFTRELMASGTANCGIPLPITLSFK
jgi:hypothetical protein